MSNKNKVIISDNPFKNLSTTEIDLFYYLLTQFDFNKGTDNNFIEDTNQKIADQFGLTLFTISRCLKNLEKQEFISMKYYPSSAGLGRKIFLNKII